MNNLRKELLEYSFKNNLSHIPSALSMVDYVDHIFTNKLVTPADHIVLGKPFGAQAYYLVWRKLGYLIDIENLNVGVKHEEIPFVDFSEETMGNALGVAAGIAIASDKLVWVNLSDAALQMGNTLEAIQFIGHNNLKNIIVTIDLNGWQVTGKTKDVMRVDPIVDLFRRYGWQVYNSIKDFRIGMSPKVYVLNTVKGSGVTSIERDVKKWHYRTIQNQQELEVLVNEINIT